jgi:hypothetical protein
VRQNTSFLSEQRKIASAPLKIAALSRIHLLHRSTPLHRQFGLVERAHTFALPEPEERGSETIPGPWLPYRSTISRKLPRK